MDPMNNIGVWIASHITGVVIGGSISGALIAFILFGIIGAIAVWGAYGALTLIVSKMQDNYKDGLRAACNTEKLRRIE